ncbi:shikimate kinase [Litoribacter populi]|uniref:shikimate kinase n=1 Tax=Litoribacter populi TaxID=2598460 RepID=UPI00117FA823|nr:shikimate kinase [Litoribacter populi]
MGNDKIILVGMPGSGKSTLGKAVAEVLQLSFFDLDQEIEASAGLSIPEIFHHHGEGYFREMEKAALEKVLSLPEGLILATGGGAPCFYNNMELINSAGTSVFLNPSLEVLLSRIEEAENRPMFLGLDQDEKLAKLESLLKKRLLFYQKAQFVIENTISAVQLTEILGC